MSILECIEDYCTACDLEFCGDYNGQSCVGIVCDSPSEVLDGLRDYIRKNCDECTGGVFRNAKVGSIGVSTILYFPSIKSNHIKEKGVVLC